METAALLGGDLKRSGGSAHARSRSQPKERPSPARPRPPTPASRVRVLGGAGKSLLKSSVGGRTSTPSKKSASASRSARSPASTGNGAGGDGKTSKNNLQVTAAIEHPRNHPKACGDSGFYFALQYSTLAP